MTPSRPTALSLCIFFLLTLTIGPSWSSTPPLAANDPAIPADQGRFIRMADNFFIVYDPSTTMATPYKDTGLTRLEASQIILRKSNASLPDLRWQAGLYPHWKGGLWLHGSPMAFKPYYRLQNYEKDAFARAIEQLPVTPQSPPMLQTGLMKLEHLLGLSGRTEIFLFSDGKDSTFAGLEPHPLDQARMLAARYDICLNIISSAVEEEARSLLEQIASVNSCSQVIDFDTVFERPEHLLGKLYMYTAANGFDNVLFDFDKSDIRPEFNAQLDRLGHLLRTNPNLYVVLSGFTDSIGTEAYNIGLSQRRAESVRAYLERNFGISRDNMLLYWYGYANPVASNDTAEGRQQNRRVTIVLRGER
ncbi:OmpA family protein [Desulfobulbus alkaliphilus]|uniref:OmpA family protein n=1 Tax=Desulfobulbus alkaliphilus TaxID=869814 RepID=UPI0019660FA0|nr:OmpA family protein [Desulfobulbus alkaliphilus]MBM9538043.1 OmpA family protein [Desulfobulbus alkaliphilus]